jgi:sugar lactone lactonase YvrE
MRKLVAILVFLMAAVAAPADASGVKSHRLPSTIDLPDGYFPEGIASGRGSTFYVGSLADGSIYRGDYRSGEGEVFTESAGPFATIGLTVDRRGRVWATGGTSGTGRVYDGRTGELLATYPFTGPLESFINDVIVTHDAAWFTDSGTRNSPDPANFQFAGEPRLFKVPLGRGGKLPEPGAVEELPVAMPDIAFPNLNGIETTPDNGALIVAITSKARCIGSTAAAAMLPCSTSITPLPGLTAWSAKVAPSTLSSLGRIGSPRFASTGGEPKGRLFGSSPCPAANHRPWLRGTGEGSMWSTPDSSR